MITRKAGFQVTHAKDMAVLADASASAQGKTPGMWPVLVMRAGHEPDWALAARCIESLTIAELDAFAEEASAILGKRVVLPARDVRHCLGIAIRELRAALSDSPELPDDVRRERYVLGDAEVLMAPHPRDVPTALRRAVELLDCAGVLDRLDVFALVGSDGDGDTR